METEIEVLIVVRRQVEAALLNGLLKPGYHAIALGAPTVGRRAQHILVLMELKDEHERHWFNVAVRTRLVPGGTIDGN